MDESFNSILMSNMDLLFNIKTLESLANLMTFLFTSAVVGIFGLKFFNQPKYPIVHFENIFEKEYEQKNAYPPDDVLPKLLTYRYRYNLFLILFVIAIELFHFALISFLPQIIGKDVSKTYTLGYYAMLSALLITGLLPNLRWIDPLLVKIRTFFHERAKIPNKGQELYQNLVSKDISYSTETVSDLLQQTRWNPTIKNSAGPSLRLLKEEDFSTEVQDTPRGKWAKLTYLLYIIEKWSNKYFFKAHIYNRELGWNVIKLKYWIVKESAIKGNDINAETDILLCKTYRLLGCLLFLADRSCTKIHECLEEIGYYPPDPPFYGIPFRQLALTSLFTGVAILVGALLSIFLSLKISNTSHISINVNKTIFIGTAYVIPLLMIPTFTVLMIKRFLSLFSDHWPLVTPQTPRYKSLNERPWHIYIIVSILGYFAGFLTLMALDADPLPYTIFETMEEAVAKTSIPPMGVYAYWSTIALVTAGFVAFRIDSYRDEYKNKKYRILLTASGCLLQITTLMTAVYIAFIGVFNNGNMYLPCIGEKLALMEETEIRKSIYFFICTIMAIWVGPALFFTSRFNTTDFERRENKREKVDDPVTIYHGEKIFEGILKNRSKNGALVEIVWPHVEEIKDYLQEHSGQFQIKIGDKPPIAAIAVEVNGKYIHLQFITIV